MIKNGNPHDWTHAIETCSECGQDSGEWILCDCARERMLRDRKNYDEKLKRVVRELRERGTENGNKRRIKRPS